MIPLIPILAVVALGLAVRNSKGGQAKPALKAQWPKIPVANIFAAEDKTLSSVKPKTKKDSAPPAEPPVEPPIEPPFVPQVFIPPSEPPKPPNFFDLGTPPDAPKPPEQPFVPLPYVPPSEPPKPPDVFDIGTPPDAPIIPDPLLWPPDISPEFGFELGQATIDAQISTQWPASQIQFFVAYPPFPVVPSDWNTVENPVATVRIRWAKAVRLYARCGTADGAWSDWVYVTYTGEL